MRSPTSEIDRPGGVTWRAQLGVAVALGCAAYLLSEAVPTPSLRLLVQSHLPLWVPASAVVFWRWCWALLHWVRAAVYRVWTYPRLRRQAARMVDRDGPVPQIAVILATFKERPEVTILVVASVLEEFDRLEGLTRPPVLIAVTGSDEDDDAIRAAFAARAPRSSECLEPELVLLRGTDGKRNALGDGLEHLFSLGFDPHGAFVMMDGDTRLEPGALAKTMPLLRLEPPVYALTTNEHARVQAPGWFCEWIHLRHGQRHLYNCSISLSGRLLCLTGRFSVFRLDALDRGFIEIVRNDRVEHWLWGQYKLLSGDDKSTWFYLLSRGRRLLYAPDVSVVTYEAVTGSPFVRGYHNLRRWGGNMVRNSPRAIAVGPRKLGLFCWWCLIDQRIAIGTTLIGPTAVAYMLWRDRVDLVASYLLWVLFSRLIRAIPAWIHARRISVVYGPIAVLSDWAGALVKVWVLTFPAKQFWMNRGGRELDSTRGQARIRDRKVVASFMLGTMACAYLLGVGQLIGALSLRGDLLRLQAQLGASPLLFGMVSALVLTLGAAGVVRLRDVPSPRMARGD